MTRKKRAFSSNILVVGVFTLLAVGSWVVFDIYRAIVKTTVPRPLQEQIKPLTPEIDQTLVSSLNNRKKYDENYLNTLQPRFLLTDQSNSAPTPSPTPSPTPITRTTEATSSGQVATNSATLNR